MDYVFISDILIFITMALVVIGFLLLAGVVFKYEALAHEDPERAPEYRQRRKSILKFYLRAVILVFITAVVLRIIA